ncbi:MAG: histidine ammonia-lyase [Phycisphaerae bacterium]
MIQNPDLPPVAMNVGADGVASCRLTGGPITLDALDAALDHPIRVEIDAAIWSRIEAGHAAVQRIAAGNTPAYGINTGFGNLCTKSIPPDQLAALQTNLILSHAVGVGAPAPDAIVRWMLLFKIHALTHGVSGISRPTLECMLRLLQHDILPIIPTQGSLGASGDLAPLAHMVLPMIGRGQVILNGQPVPAQQALADGNIPTITLGPKEGLALINGTQFMNAYAAAMVIRARRLVKHADIIASMSLEGIRGSLKPFDARLHQLRPHPGAIAAADNIRRLMTDSQVLESHANCDRVQDPYSLRCVPQVHGAIRDALTHAAGVVQTEINAVTDNPLIFDDGEVVSGGGFHGEPLALVLDYLAIALSELASISERRVYLLLSGVDDLPQLLMQNTGINSGFMVPQYTAAALVNENKVLATPASVDSIPTSLGQEDHVSMGATSATKAWRILENTETVLAIEQMCAAQAIDYRQPLLPGIGPRIAHAQVRQVISHTEKDRLFGDDIEASLALLRSQASINAVEDQLGILH